ncbi:MAG: hypothetical protein AVDCRST_MAG03-2110, partial [uncultured Rubrobacteraceae bacterium]
EDQNFEFCVAGGGGHGGGLPGVRPVDVPVGLEQAGSLTCAARDAGGGLDGAHREPRRRDHRLAPHPGGRTRDGLPRHTL